MESCCFSPGVDPHIFDDRSTIDLGKLSKKAAKKRKDAIEGRFIKLGAATAVAMQAMGVGGWLLEHAVAFYAYAQSPPATVFAQYFYANATHEVAMQVIGYSVCGISLSTIATTIASMAVGVFVIKAGIEIYNLCVEEECQINLGIIEVIQEIFFRLFAWLK
jgi:hypothetical protein